MFQDLFVDKLANGERKQIKHHLHSIKVDCHWPWILMGIKLDSFIRHLICENSGTNSTETTRWKTLADLPRSHTVSRQNQKCSSVTIHSRQHSFNMTIILESTYQTIKVSYW